MSEGITIRGSSTPLAWICPESAMDYGVKIDPPNPAAELGTATHKWAEHVDAPDDERPDIGELADRYGVDAQDLEARCAYVGVAWRSLKEFFPNAITEAPLESDQDQWLKFTGTADVLSVNGAEAAILDYKTGFLESDHGQQGRSYAHMVCDIYPDVQKVYVVFAWTTLRFLDGAWYTREELDSWHADFERRVRNGTGKFMPGPHCGHCARRYDCAGSMLYTQQAIALVENDVPVDITVENKAEMGPRLVDYYRSMRYLEARCDDFRKAIRGIVEEVGPLPSGDGKQLALNTTERRSLDAMTAWPILDGMLTDDEINTAVSISLKKCQDAVAAKVEKGKGAARQNLLDLLDDAHAVKRKTTTTLREVKEPKE